MSAIINLIGQRFDRLSVIAKASSNYRGRACFICRCDCGEEVVRAGYLLRNGETTSCGCKKTERAKALAAKRVRHGMTNTPEFRVWTQMISRCTNPKDHRYSRYGDRGITVDERWLESFETFVEDMGLRPFPGAELDRQDNDGPYSPENCRWVTAKVNANNRSDNRLITYRGRTQSLALWADEIGIEQATLRVRLESGWTVERALTQPVRKITRWGTLGATA